MPCRSHSAFCLRPAFLLVLLTLQSLSLTLSKGVAEDAAEEGFKPAFNGKDLLGKTDR